MIITKKTIARFWKFVDKKTDDECWLWVGALRKDNRYHYEVGHFRADGKARRAHRVSYEIHYREIPEGLEVCHRCDDPRCVNPAHLFLGTHKDNMHDMVVKKRYNNSGMPGEKNPNAKITVDQVIEIRKLHNDGLTYYRIAKIFKLNAGHVRQIVLKERWGHI